MHWQRHFSNWLIDGQDFWLGRQAANQIFMHHFKGRRSAVPVPDQGAYTPKVMLAYPLSVCFNLLVSVSISANSWFDLGQAITFAERNRCLVIIMAEYIWDNGDGVGTRTRTFHTLTARNLGLTANTPLL